MSAGTRANQKNTDQAAANDEPQQEGGLFNLGKVGKEGLSSAVDTARALHKLVLADLALARFALVRALVWLCVVAVFGASSWLLLMGALIALLQHFGMSWLVSLSIAAALSLLVTVLGALKMLRYFGYTSMEATRRQLKAMGLGDDEDEATDKSTAAPTAAGDAQ